MATTLADRLKAVPLFASLSRKQLNKLIDVGWIGTFKEGKVLCAEGRGGDDFFVILEGEAQATRAGRKIRTLTQGDYFGEIALLRKVPRTATVRARTEMGVSELTRDVFIPVVSGYGASAGQADVVIGDRLAAFTPGGTGG